MNSRGCCYLIFALLLSLFIPGRLRPAGLEEDWQALSLKNQDYLSCKRVLESEFPARGNLPGVPFYLFGMGPRAKLIYQKGVLKEALSGKVIRKWDISTEQIIPSEYAVLLWTDRGDRVIIREDERAIWIEEGENREALSESSLHLPDFSGKKYAPVLRVLHQELLVNILDGRPLPNYLVYRKPWYRDGAMVCKCLELTGNLRLVKAWILGLREPFDLNAHHAEPDNLGQALYMISLVSDSTHPLVEKIVKEIENFRSGNYISGLTDGRDRPVFQTKWLKYGLRRLGMVDRFEIPAVADSYSSLFWLDYRQAGRPDATASRPDSLYPYLGWARAHFQGDRGGGIISNLDYPLTWETEASEADYDGMKVISEEYTKARTSAPHTWNSAEMFLYLYDQ